MFIENVYETPLESIIAHEGQGAIQTGDFIVNHAGWEHGLHNESANEVKLLVIEVDLADSNQSSDRLTGED